MGGSVWSTDGMEIACAGIVDVVGSVFGGASCCVMERKRGLGGGVGGGTVVT